MLEIFPVDLNAPLFRERLYEALLAFRQVTVDVGELGEYLQDILGGGWPEQ